MRRRTLLFTAIALAACGSTEPSAIISGNWAGFTAGVAGLQATLLATNGSVTGNGTLVVVGGSNFTVTITGVATGQTVSLTLTSGLHPAILYQATITNSTTLTGTLTGSGFIGESLVLKKEPTS